MKNSRRHFLSLAAAALTVLVPGSLKAQRGRGRPQGAVSAQRRGRFGQGSGTNGRGVAAPAGNDATGPRGNNDPALAADHTLIQRLFGGRNLIRRQIRKLPNGVETLTETENTLLRSILVTHVESMKKRAEQGRPIHQRDPLFRELFRNASKVRMEVTRTAGGVMVRQTSDDPLAVQLVQRHAEVVSLFLKNGPAEARLNHTL